MNKEAGKRQRIALLVGLYVLSLSAMAAEEVGDEHVDPPKPTTTLSAAANAANAAVSAAAAAAEAANAASAASAAAVEAINAILPPSQRVKRFVGRTDAADSTTQTLETAAPSSEMVDEMEPLESLDDDYSMDNLLSADTDSSNQDPSSRFAVPTERSLVGLIGSFEVTVAADARGDYSAGVESQNFEPVETISSMDLAEAITMSLGFSRDVHVATSRVDQAKAQTGQAKAFLLPTLLLNVRTGRERSSPGVEIDSGTGDPETVSNHSRSDGSLTFKQPLLDLPSFYDWRRREIVEQSRLEGVRSSQGDAYLETVNAYLSLTSARIQVNMAIDYEKQLQELFQYIDKRAAAGVATHSDKERVKARSFRARSARIEQEAAQAAAGVEFVRLVNLAPQSMRLPDLEDLGISIVPDNVQEAMPMAIATNPDIAVLREELKAARYDQESVKGRYFPRFDLEVSSNKTAHAGGSKDSQRDERMMLVMNWSLYNGGGDQKLKEEKTARAIELNYRLDDQRRRVLQSVTAQYAILEGVRQRIDAGYSELSSISSAAKAMSNRMVSGKQSLLDMLDVYDRFFQARTHLVNLHTQEMIAVAEIVRLLQGAPTTQAVAQVQNPTIADSIN